MELTPPIIKADPPREVLGQTPVMRALFAECYRFETVGIAVTLPLHRHAPMMLSKNGISEEIDQASPVYVTVTNTARIHEFIVPAIRIVRAAEECRRLSHAIEAWQGNKAITERDSRLLDLTVAPYAPRPFEIDSKSDDPAIAPWHGGDLHGLTARTTGASTLLRDIESFRAERIRSIGKAFGRKLDPWGRYDLNSLNQDSATGTFSGPTDNVVFLSEGSLPASLRRQEAVSWILRLRKKSIAYEDFARVKTSCPTDRDKRTKRDEELARFIQLVEHLHTGERTPAARIDIETIALALDMTPDYDINGAQVAVREMTMHRQKKWA